MTQLTALYPLPHVHSVILRDVYPLLTVAPTLYMPGCVQ